MEVLYQIPEIENGRIRALNTVMHFTNGVLSVAHLDKNPDDSPTILDWLEYLSVRTSVDAPLELMSGDGGGFSLFKIGGTVYRPLRSTFDLEDLTLVDTEEQTEVLAIPLG